MEIRWQEVLSIGFAMFLFVGPLAYCESRKIDAKREIIAEIIKHCVDLARDGKPCK